MTEGEKKVLQNLGIEESELEPTEDQTTIADLVEALDILTNIVLGGEKND